MIVQNGRARAGLPSRFRPSFRMAARSSSDQGREARPIDDLHGVVKNIALGPHGVDRDDVGVMKHGGRAGLHVEPGSLPDVGRWVKESTFRATRRRSEICSAS